MPKLATQDESETVERSVTSSGGAAPAAWPELTVAQRLRRVASFRNAAAIYLFVFMFIVFAVWVPSTFLTWGTWQSLLSDQAITCLVAVGFVVPIAAGILDLAVGTEAGLGSILVAWLLVDKHVDIPVAIVLSLAAGAGVGIFSWLMITRVKIPSFIATLGVSSVLTAVIEWVSGSQQILNLPSGFAKLGGNELLGIQYPFWIMLVVGVIVWYVLERTRAGRRVYATGGDFGGVGGNPEAARLAGVNTSRVILFSLVACGVIAAMGGILESSQLSTGDPTIGPGYLLPVIAAVFLGSTQFRGGRMNVWGTVVAAYVLATGVKGLQLAGAPVWIPDLFNGAALLVAVGLAQWRRLPISRLEAIRRFTKAQSRQMRIRAHTRRAEQLARYAQPDLVVTIHADTPRTLYRRPALVTRLREGLSFRNAAAIYLFVFMFIVFAVWVPSTFLTWGTWQSLLSDQAITCLVAVGLVVPIAAGAIDLAVGTEAGLGSILVAWLLVNKNLNIPLAIVLALVAGGLVGVLSWVMITRVKIPSFIATLGVSSVLTAVIEWVSGSQQILNLPSGFAKLGGNELLGIQYPFWIMLVVGVIVWYVLERTPAGRRVYATGGNPEAARLAGVNTSRVILFSLVACGVIAAMGGILESSQLSTGDPTIGPGYLLPVIAAVFLGSTQFRGGRMNVWGTVVAAYVLATGVKGLQLAGAPIWIPDLFNGAALLVAVGLAQWRRTPTGRRQAILRALGRARDTPSPAAGA